MREQQSELLASAKGNGKGALYSSLWKPVTELQSVTCHMGPHIIILPSDTGERAPP